MSSTTTTSSSSISNQPNKQRYLSRSTSFERLRHFSYVWCSLNLPLVAWLRTALPRIVSATVQQARALPLTRTLFAVIVYFTFAAIFIQLALCLLYLSYAFVPIGFLFMVTCLYTIATINLYCLNHTTNEELKRSSRKRQSRRQSDAFPLIRKRL